MMLFGFPNLAWPLALACSLALASNVLGWGFADGGSPVGGSFLFFLKERGWVWGGSPATLPVRVAGAQLAGGKGVGDGYVL